jgi:hypothetical protein
VVRTVESIFTVQDAHGQPHYLVEAMEQPTRLTFFRSLRLLGLEAKALRFLEIAPDVGTYALRQQMARNLEGWARAEELEQQAALELQRYRPGELLERERERRHRIIYDVILEVYRRAEREEQSIGFLSATAVRAACVLAPTSGGWGTAVRLLEGVVADSPCQPTALLLLAHIWRDHHNYNQSTAYFTQYLHQRADKGVREELERVTQRDWFATLGLPVASTVAEIDRRVHDLAMAVHPGKSGKRESTIERVRSYR